MRLWKKIVLGLLAVVALAAAALVWKIGPRNVYGMLRYDQREEGKLAVGDRAPDAMLVALDGRSPVSVLGGDPSKPLVLVFGSYT
jgi:hypothetical protein